MIQLLAISGLSLVLLFVILTILKKTKQNKDIFLLIFLLAIGAELLYRYFEISVTQESNNLLIILDLVYWAVMGPAMYLYISFTIEKDKKLKSIHLLHLLPVLIVTIPFFRYLNSGNHEINFFQSVNEGNWFDYTVIILWDYISPIYYVFILIKLYKHRNKVTSYYSNIYKKDLKWALYLASGFTVYIVVGILAYYINTLSNLKFEYYFSESTIIILVLYVFGIGIYGYRQKGIFSEQVLNEINQLNINIDTAQSPQSKKKYLHSSLDKEEAVKILQDLRELMNSDKVYLDFDLTITQLAQKLNTSMHKLSQVINSEFNQNFFDFVNSFRVEEVKRRLNIEKFKNYKIMSIAYDCGFNSKSAFYSSFNKSENLTPTQYRNQIKEKTKVFTN